MTRDEDRGPRPLSWSLRRIASRVQRVDLVGFAAVEDVWSSIDAARASRARPQRLAGTELVVAVPSGTHAARAKLDAAAILDELVAALCGEGVSAPTSLRVVVGLADENVG